MATLATHLIIGIQQEFRKNVSENQKIKSMLELISAGGGTYVEAGEYASEIGRILSEAILKYITPVSIPGGKITKEMADEILKPLLKKGFVDIEAIARAVQANMNDAAGIALKAVGIRQNANRLEGLCKAAAKYETTEQALWVLGEPVTTYLMTITAEVLKANIEFQGAAGYAPKIIRKSVGKCCDYCDKLDGVYEYPTENSDVFRRHDRCRCTVDYAPGDGSLQNVHTKDWR